MILALMEASILVGLGTVATLASGERSAEFGMTGVLGQAAALPICCIIAFYYNDLYDVRIVRRLGDLTARLVQALGMGLILLAVIYSLFPQTRLDDGPLFWSALLGAVVAFLLRAVDYGLMRRRAFVKRVLILGTGELAQTLVEEIDARPYLGYQIVGLVGDLAIDDESHLRYPRLGPCRDLAKIAKQAGAHRIIVALTERRGRLPMQQLLEAEACRILIEDGLETYERVTERMAIEALRPSLLIFSQSFNKTRLQLGLRRIVSLGVAAVAIVALTPLMSLIAVAIKLDSPGPVLFRQARVGPQGRRFTLFKFRTMIPATATTSEWVRDNQERITRVGRWLRRYRLDEFPQFFNVLRGDMNLVGPRPHPVSNFELFSQQIPYYVLRTSVRPGVTGWAQIRYGYANNLDEEIEKMRYDLYYIKHLSLWFDLRIIFDTIKIMLRGEGSEAADARASRVLIDTPCSSDARSLRLTVATEPSHAAGASNS